MTTDETIDAIVSAPHTLGHQSPPPPLEYLKHVCVMKYWCRYHEWPTREALRTFLQNGEAYHVNFFVGEMARRREIHG